jgi:capsular exopolysaccharide synthesis family protein
VIEPAATPDDPISPRPTRNAVLGFVLALLLAGGLVPLADRVNRKLRDPDELEGWVGAELLAMIPDVAFPGRPPSPATREAFQMLRAALRYFNLDQRLGVVVVASPSHADGKTTVATNLALALAHDGQDVVLVDADLRRPRAAVRLGLEGTHGLEHVLVDGTPVEQALSTVGNEDRPVKVLASVDSSTIPAVMLGSTRMRELLAELAAKHDIVIVDTPPILAVSDAIPLLAHASGVVLVSQMNQTSFKAVTRTRAIIEAAEGKILGCVATGLKSQGSYSYGYYGYGYGYGDKVDKSSPPADSNGSGENSGSGGKRRRLSLPGRSSSK